MPIKQRLAASYRAAAARGRSLLMRATTPWLREHLGAEISRCESMAEEIERAPEADPKGGQESRNPRDKQNPARW
jgi:hypothetical protein